MRAFRVLTPLAVTAMGLVPAVAQMAREQQSFFALDPAAPELANLYLQTHPGIAIDIVTYRQAGKDPMQLYYSLGPVARSREGTCRFTATQIFPHRLDDGSVLWNGIPSNPAEHADPPTVMAAIAAAPCPRQSQETYIALDDGITDAEFVAISKFLKDVSGSEQKFDQAAAYLPFIIAPAAADKFAVFRSALLRPTGDTPQLRAVLGAGVATYDLAIADSSSGTPSMFLTISKTADGFQMLNFQAQF